jgi:hypothetical protein
LGLQFAHQQSLIHRDIKPSNLLVTVDGQVKLLDLGIALFNHSNATTHDVSSLPVGTAPYMPPEQWIDSSTVDARADLFSLGCTLLKLLTGKTPEDRKNSHPTNSTTLKLNVSEFRSDLPRVVDRLLGQLLSAKPDDRPNSANKVAEILHPWTHDSNLPALVARIHSGVSSCKSTPLPQTNQRPRSSFTKSLFRRRAALVGNHGVLPSLWHTDRTEPWENFSWRASVLPFIESSTLYDSLDFEQPPLMSNNRGGVATLVSLFQCPSTPTSPRLVQSLGTPDFDYDNLRIGACDYTAVHDVAIQDVNNPAPGAWRSMTIHVGEGMVPGEVQTDVLNPHVRTMPAKLKAIGDGLSQTALVVEQAGKPLKYDLVRHAEPVLPVEGAWATAEFSSFYADGINVDNLSGLYGFHAGGVVAMCDGSVHFFTENMEMEVLTALLSREGDEIIDANDWQ